MKKIKAESLKTIGKFKTFENDLEKTKTKVKDVSQKEEELQAAIDIEEADQHLIEKRSKEFADMYNLFMILN